MAAFKRIFLMLAIVLVAMAGAGGTAFAQFHGVVTCTAFAVPPDVRVEGLAELVGDIVANCSNSQPDSPGAPVFVTNVTVTLNTNVTNSILPGTGIPNAVADAVIIVDEKNGTPRVGVPTPPGVANSVPTVPVYGTLASNTTLVWNGITLPTPCTTCGINNPGPGSGTSVDNHNNLTVRISNIRANASQFSAGPSISSQIIALLTFTGPTSIPITNNVLNVAVPTTGLIVKYGGVLNVQQCVSIGVDGSGDPTPDANFAGEFSVTLTEGFASSFKTIGIPTTVANGGTIQVEDGYFTPNFDLGDEDNSGGASQSTRFIFRFYNVPAGITINADNEVDNGALLHLQLVTASTTTTGPNSDGSGGFPGNALGAEGHTSVGLDSSGGGFVVYEVTSDDPFSNESITVDFDVSVNHTSETVPGLGTAQVSAAFAPLSTITTASSSAPVPRFIDNAVATGILSVNPCFTNLLFPFVTNQAGFDTGMSIANTSMDDKGTPNQQGACTLYYFGTVAGGGATPPNQTTSTVAAGQTIVWTLSGGNSADGIVGTPGFQGYIMAYCQFQFAHGFAFITNGFGGPAQTLAEGYLALVVPWDGVPGDRGQVGTLLGLSFIGETLGN